MIEVEALTRVYGRLIAVDQVSFEIGRGEIVGLLGHNGAGKTTIMKMLTGYLEPTGGIVRIDGLDIISHREAVQSRIGYLPENDPLYPEMTVIDYLDFAASLQGVPEDRRIERIREAIDKTELSSKAMDPIATLSRGFRQRVGVAQTMLHNPRVLILDEPTNGLDPTQVQHMRGLIRSLAHQATVIISTHILQEVQAICDRVIIIRNGRKALDATMEELRAGKRLLVTVDAPPERMLDLMASVEGIGAVDMVEDSEVGRRYALNLSEGGSFGDTAPRIADRVTKEGIRLYGLQPEKRDLETVFGEISAQ